jgi:DNA-binding NarL/FixJ family response regulator
MQSGGGILIVDSSRAFRETMQDIIAQQALGHVPLYAVGTAAEALQHVRQQRPDVVFIDIDAPGDNGLALARRIRAIAAPRIIIMSVFDMPEYRDGARQSGADGFLCKENVCPGDILEHIEGAYAGGMKPHKYRDVER